VVVVRTFCLLILGIFGICLLVYRRQWAEQLARSGPSGIRKREPSANERVMGHIVAFGIGTILVLASIVGIIQAVVGHR
jgi:hypothetical protein